MPSSSFASPVAPTSRRPAFDTLLTPPPSLRRVEGEAEADEESPAGATAVAPVVSASQSSSVRSSRSSSDSWLDEAFEDPYAYSYSYSYTNTNTRANRADVAAGPSRRRSLLEPVTVPSRLSWSIDVAHLWNSVLKKSKHVLLILTVALLWPFGYLSFHVFSNNTDSTYHAMPGSLSQMALDAFHNNYPSNDWNDPMHPTMMIVLESLSDQPLTAGVHDNNTKTEAYYQARNFSYGLAETLNHTCWTSNEILDKSSKYPNHSSSFNEAETNHSDTDTDSHNKCQSTLVKVTSYYSLQQEALGWLANAMTTPNGTTVLIQVQYQLLNGDTRVRERTAQLRNTILDYGSNFTETHSSTGTSKASPAAFNISYTGISFFANDLSAATRKDLARMDVMVLPLALALLGMVLPQARASVVWIVPLFTMISTVSAWSIVMRFVVRYIQVTHFVPSVMMSLTLGMGIDYTLFLLSRYLEHTPTGDTTVPHTHMLRRGGHVVLLSGLTLMATFLGLVSLPLEMLQSVGIGAAVAIACSLVVNLTLMPCLLHTPLGVWIVVKDTTTGSTGDSSNEDEQSGRNTFWTRLSKHLLHPYKSVIIMLLLSQLLFPIARMATNMRTSLSFDLMLPATSPSFQTFQRLSRQWGSGQLAPYRILFDASRGNVTMDSVEAFGIMHTVIDELIAIDHEDETNGFTHIAVEGAAQIRELNAALMDTLGMSYTAHEKQLLTPSVNLMSQNALELAHTTQYSGIAVLKNARIPFALYNSAKYCAHIKPYCPVEALHLLDYIDQVATSADRHATYVTATLGADPFSSQGTQWLQDARATIARLEEGGLFASSKMQVHVLGSAAIAQDAVDAVLRALPTVIGVTILVVFVLMGLFFQSIVPPLRSVVSITITLGVCYGWTVLVYQKGILNFLHIPALSSTGQISWLVPVMAFSIIVGLALDYDVFLVSRILEHRRHSSHNDSIVAGLDATGGIITAAGCIMALAFGGLLLSSSPVLYQWAFMLCTAVLLDTFVIRTLVVPIVLGWTGSKWSWWPQHFAIQEGTSHLQEPLLPSDSPASPV